MSQYIDKKKINWDDVNIVNALLIIIYVDIAIAVIAVVLQIAAIIKVRKNKSILIASILFLLFTVLSTIQLKFYQYAEVAALAIEFIIFCNPLIQFDKEGRNAINYITLSFEIMVLLIATIAFSISADSKVTYVRIVDLPLALILYINNSIRKGQGDWYELKAQQIFSTIVQFQVLNGIFNTLFVGLYIFYALTLFPVNLMMIFRFIEILKHKNCECGSRQLSPVKEILTTGETRSQSTFQ